jgi:hypothetical protein
MELIPLSRFKSKALQDLFQEEKEEWTKNLRWDYSEPLQIISSLIDTLCLPGLSRQIWDSAGYVFYLEENAEVIGDCFVSNGCSGLGVEEALMNVTVETLKANRNVDRIESQFVSFKSWPCEASSTGMGSVAMNAI